MIISRLRGGLGNQMFQYAAGRARALERGEDLALDLSWFDGPGAENPKRTYDLGIFKADQKRASKLRIAIAKLRGAYVDGFWQSERYFEKATARIRADFSFKEPVLPGSGALMREIAKPDSVCLNVRRMDFVTGGIFVGAGYYERAVRAVLDRAPGAAFFVFSDDLEWCRTSLGFVPRMTLVGHEHAGERFGNYLQLMSACHHFIIPNSTFGWWAAWLGDRPGKIVVASEGWQRPPGEQDDPILKNWLRM